MENYTSRTNRDIVQHKYHEVMESKKWYREIPPIKFKEYWNVYIIPAYHGAVVRFLVSNGEAMVSVYLDCYDMLGYAGEPYWEMYPYEKDTFRCALKDTDQLVEAIEKSLYDQKYGNNK